MTAADGRSGPAAGRTWWLRVVVVFLGAVAIWRLVDLTVSVVVAPGYSRPGHVARGVATSVLVALLFALVLRWEGRGLSAYGLAPRRTLVREAGRGALGYLVPCCLAAVVVLLASPARVEVVGGAVELALEALSVLVLVLLFEAVPEELIFRGYLYATLRERLPAWASVLAQAAAFCALGALIGAAVTVDRQLLFAFFALGLGAVRAATGSVFVTIGFHAAFQTVSQLLLGGTWSTLELVDPGGWLTQLAVGLVPLLLGPLVLVVAARRRSLAQTVANHDRG